MVPDSWHCGQEEGLPPCPGGLAPWQMGTSVFSFDDGLSRRSVFGRVSSFTGLGAKPSSPSGGSDSKKRLSSMTDSEFERLTAAEIEALLQQDESGRGGMSAERQEAVQGAVEGLLVGGKGKSKGKDDLPPPPPQGQGQRDSPLTLPPRGNGLGPHVGHVIVWNCPLCTFHNEQSAHDPRVCAVCEHRPPEGDSDDE